MNIIKDFFEKNKITDENLDKSNIPGHIAIIMDGNGRWAKKRGLPRSIGHKWGVEALRETIKVCSELNVEFLTLYAFSTENWKRPEEEVSALMQLLVNYLRMEIEELHKNNVKIRAIGDINKLPSIAIQEIKKAIELTKENKGLNVNIALNYGGRAEIINAVKSIVSDLENDKFTVDEIDSNLFEQYLYTKDIPDPDLIIRPSGELRISNFLLWQSAYSEFWFSDILWPDFKREDLLNAIYDYQKRDRRYGAIKQRW